MKFFHKTGFTLVELLIVIAIIGTLAGVLLSQFGGVTASARATKCKSNLRNLAQAVQAYGMANGYYPPAGSFQWVGMDQRNGKYRAGYHESKGWIGWLARDAYQNTPNASVNTKSWVASLSEEHDGREAVTNGVLWRYTGRDASTYVCPEHLKLCRKEGFTPQWSYVMNSRFGYDWTDGAGSASGEAWAVVYGGVEADKVLLFAEIPFKDVGAGSVSVKGGNGDSSKDCVLQFKNKDWNGTPEYIGFNHAAGKRLTAHIVFADAHVETLALPTDASNAELVELTTNLCQGADLRFADGRYQHAERN